MTMSQRVTRRELMVLAGAVAVATGGSIALRRTRPVGTLLPDSPVVQAALAQPAPTAGNPDGNLDLLVFADFNCPVCRPTHRAMLQAVAADGRVRLKFLDWPIFGADSHAAARIAIAADAQRLYLPVHSRLMAGGRADADSARAAVADAGGDLGWLDQTLRDSGARIEGRLSRNAIHAFGLGLGGTPGHLIGRLRVLGRTSAGEFRRAFAEARRAAR